MNRSVSIVILSILSLMVSNSIFAQPLSEAMHECMKQVDSLQRLHCFEELTKSIGSKVAITSSVPGTSSPDTMDLQYIDQPVQTATTVATAPLRVRTSWDPKVDIAKGIRTGKVKIGQWDVTVSDNQMGQTLDVELSLKSFEGINQYGAPIELIIECKQGQGSANILWDEPLVEDVPIAISFNGKHNQAATNGWRFTEGSQQWELNVDIKPLLNAIQSHKNMSVDVESFEALAGDDSSDGSFHVIWNIENAEYALQSFYRQCQG